jgi:hypothetical protein
MLTNYTSVEWAMPINAVIDEVDGIAAVEAGIDVLNRTRINAQAPAREDESLTR